ncbi:MAG TPA: hypothetical protein P5120_04335 [Spirochaetota bacterium]|nr:hypothetical protein [Spirochaetota bacterium]
MKNLIEDIIYAAIIGDASGYTLDGMKSAHIKAVFKETEGYLDPAAALKNNMDKWRKPGLYSSITQLMLIAAASVQRNVFRTDRFSDAVKKAPEHADSEFSFFRGAGKAEQAFIISARTEKKEQIIPFARSCARLLPVAIPLLLSEDEDLLLNDTLRFISLFTADAVTASYTYIFLRILKDLSRAGGKGGFMHCVSESALNGSEYLNNNQHRIFDCGYNPDSFIEEIRLFTGLLNNISDVKDVEKAEKIICESVNTRLKSPVARGSVNLPETVLPFAITLAALTLPHSSIFHTASREGGAASPLAAVSAALTTAFYGLDVPDILREELANKKKISGMVELLSSKNNRNEITAILYDSEPGLTSKEMEEYRARIKKEPKKQTPQKNRRNPESELTKHVVESWTKIDKAKWRKKREKDES